MSSRKIAGILVKLGLDGKEVSKELTAIDKSVSKSAKELKEIDKALKFDPKSTELLAQKQEVLADMLEQSRKKVLALESAQEQMAKAAANGKKWEAAYAPLGEEIEKVRAKMNALQQKKSEMDSKLAGGSIDTAQYDKYQKELDETSAEMKKLERQKKELEASFEGGHITADEYRQYKRDLEQARAETARLETETQKLDNVTDKSSKAFREAAQNTKEYKDAMDKLKNSSAEARQKIEELINFAIKLGTALASAAVAGATAAIKVGSSFDTAMSSVKALSEAEGVDFERLRNAAQEMGATTSKTATESADALGYMALAGWDVEKMLSSLEPMLRASEAGNLGLARTSDLVTDSMAAMGVSVDQLNRYLDITAQAQRSSNTSLEQMLQAYVGAGGMFRQLNTSMEESATLIGVLANRGKKGSEAGTALNSILINLIGANKNAANAMDALGISAYDAEGNFIGVTETLRLVYAALQDCNDEQRNLFTAKIGGKTQYDTLMALLTGVSEEYDDLYKKIKNSNGALEETAKVMRDNLKGDVVELTSALEDMGIKANDHFTAELREAVKVVTKEVRKLTSEFKSGDLGESLEKIAAAFSKLIVELVKFSADKGIPAAVNFFEFIADNGDKIIAIVAGIGGAFVAWKIAGVVIAAAKAVAAFVFAVKSGATAMQALSFALNANPWILLATAAAGLVAALVTLAVQSDEVGKRFKERKKEIEDLNNELERNKQTTQGSIAASEAEIVSLRKKADTYEALRNIENRTEAQEERLRDLAGELQKYMPDGIQLIDEETGAYNSLADSIDSVVASMRKKAKASAFEEELTSLYKQQIEAKKIVDEAEKAYIRNMSSPLQGAGSVMGVSYSLPDFEKQYNDAISSLENIDKRIEEISGEIGQAYEEFSEPPETNGKSFYEKYAEEQTKKAKQAAEDAAKAQEEAYQSFSEKMEKLDNKKDVHGISDEEYWQERRRILAENRLLENKEWHKLNDETKKHFAELSEKEKETYEKQIKDQAEALKERKDLNDEFTEEMYYDELERLISCLDKQSETYKKFNSEILKGRKALADELKKQDAKTQKEQVETAGKTAKEIQTKYSSMLKEVESEQEAYRNKLMNLSPLYTSDIKTDENGNKSGKFVLEDIDKAIAAVNAYDNALTKLEKRGAGKNIINYAESLTGDDAEYFKKMLGKMSDAELQAYSEKYDKYIETINKRSADRFAPQVQAINDGFVKELKALFKTLPEDMQKVGIDSIDGFIKGFTGDKAKLIEAVNEKCDELLDSFKTGLDSHSPSKKTEKYGEYASEGFINGFEKISGAKAASDFTDEFIKAMADKDKQLYNVMNDVFAGNAAAALSQMNKEAASALENIPAAKLPSGAFGNGSDNENKNAARKIVSDERVISLLEEIIEYLSAVMSTISRIANEEKVLKAELAAVFDVYLDGKTISETTAKYLFNTKVREGN